MKQLLINTIKNSEYMKLKSLSILAILAISGGYAHAQGEMEAYKMSRNDLTGTARSVSMGGAFGALGGDISGIAINPAGIGVYKTSEVVTTLNFQNTKSETQMKTAGGSKVNESKFKFTFDNLAFVGAIPTNDSDIVPLINVGFSYNRIKSFDRKYKMQGDNINSSLADYMARRASNSYNKLDNPDKQLIVDRDINGINDYGDYVFREYDWLPAFGYNSYMIQHTSNGIYVPEAAFAAGGMNNDLMVREKGTIDSYDFNIGTTFADVVSFGLTVSVTDLDYRLSSDYSEALNNTNGFALGNELHTEGTGWQLKTGLIFKPVQELRIGLAYHSPTWYNMTDYYWAGINYNMEGLIDRPIQGIPESGKVESGDYVFDYKFRSPDKFIASIAGVIGQTAIISADYEYTNYKGSMKLFNRNGDNLSHLPNDAIKEHYEGASTIRVGAEVRVTPQFALRAGYAWMQSPLKKEFKDNSVEAETVGSDSHFILDGDTNYITCGAGYRFTKNFYTDIAFLMRNKKSDLYAFDESDRAEIKDQTFQGMLTLGFRF